ncbi:MAG: hypothetical protein JTJ12_23705 [Eubacterium sp.]|nr:hypothetical protein [Eubacterium sp.]
MNHESRILQDMLIAGKIGTDEFKERIDAINTDTYMGLAEKFMKCEIGEEEFVERYNRLIEQDAEKHWEPIRPHEHI